jgi:hypothetical protein
MRPFFNRLLKSVGVVPLFPTPQTRGQKNDSMESQPLFFLIHFWPKRNPGVPDSLFKNQTVWDVAVLMRHTVSVSHYHKYKKVHAAWRILMPESDDRGFWAQKTNSLCKRRGTARYWGQSRVLDCGGFFCLLFFLFLRGGRSKSFFVLPQPNCVG